MGDRITYDDDGNPVVVKSRPPRPGKARKSFSCPAGDVDVDGCNTQTKQQKSNSNTRTRGSFSGPSCFTDTSSSEGRLTAIFEIEGKSYDVVFEESKLSWTPVGGTSSKAKGDQAKDMISLFKWLYIIAKTQI